MALADQPGPQKPCGWEGQHAAPRAVLFAPLLVLPREVLWKGQGVYHVAVAEAVSGHHGDSVIADPPVINKSPAVASILPSGGGEGEVDV